MMNSTKLYVGRAHDLLSEVLPAGRVVVITDVNIDRLYPQLVRRYDHIIIGLGETNKSLQTVENIYSRLMEIGADRSTFILGIGGGIVTDIAGFVAATYMRGLDFGFVSTTLLGEVDASIGGKNGVNIGGYKNMVGTFRAPRFVISDMEMLATLPQRELRAGMAEVVKAALVGDAELFDYIERYASEDIYRDISKMRYIVERAVAVKMRIVEADALEGGLRRVLNLGHTLGHAIERCSREVNHGEAVAMGLVLIARAAVRYGVLSIECAERVEALLSRLGFKLQTPVSLHDVLREVKYDKKKRDNILRVVMPCEVGRCEIVEMTFDEFERLFE